MTGAEFSGVDIDLLADYVGGALDGTPEEAAVARLVAEDPAWREAHAELAAATGAVGAALRSWGAEPEPMPAEVVARLDAALLTVGSGGGDVARAGSVGSASVAGAADAGAAGPARHLTAVRDGEAQPSTTRSRSRRLRWAAPIGVAAAALAFLGFGVQQFGSSGNEDQATSAAAPGSAEQFSLSAEPAVSSSGRDYTPESLAELPSQIMAAPEAAEAQPSDAAGEQRAKTGVAATDASLDRLRLPQALLACLEAIQREHAGTIAAQTVDYGLFTGIPAAIVRFTAGDGSWAWAVGADCGTRGSGSDKLAAVRVG